VKGRAINGGLEVDLKAYFFSREKGRLFSWLAC